MSEETPPFRADLHTHTTASDGDLTPMELLHAVKEKGLQAFSITDHDTIAAYTPELFTAAEKLKIKLLIGVELSTFFEGISVHVLGYGFDPSSEPLLQLLGTLQERREERNRAMLKLLSQAGMHLDENELLRFGGMNKIGRPHIAKCMIEKGYVASMDEAFKKYLSDTGSCYVSGNKIETEEALEVLHAAHGKAVLAHPHFFKRRRFVKKVLKLPFDGIECHYGNLHSSREKEWIQLAQEKGLIATGGSDFHFNSGDRERLGASWSNEEVFNALISRN